MTFASDHAPQWLTQLVQTLVERASMEGSLWLPVLHNILVTLERLCENHDSISIKDLTR